MEREFAGGRKLRLMIGDITQVEADAIVNAANQALAGGGGVDGAIHRAGGPYLRRELNEIRQREAGCATGSAVVTQAYLLPARYVFHAVGPIYRDGKHGEAALLGSCYDTCLRLADGLGVEVISFPSISTGAYGYPMKDAAKVAIDAVSAYLGRDSGTVREVIFVLFDQKAFDVHAALL